MTGTIRINCLATKCHPTYLKEAEWEMEDEEFEKLKDDSTYHFGAGEVVTSHEPAEPGGVIMIQNRHGEELWVEDRFIQWEGQA